MPHRTIRQLLEQARTEEYASAEALAVYYGCSVKTIYRAVKVYDLPGVLRCGRGGKLLIPRRAMQILEAHWAYRPSEAQN